MKLDDSVFEYALYDVLSTLKIRAGSFVQLDELRDAWRSTALRHSDLVPAIHMLVDSGSLAENPVQSDSLHWTLTRTGHERIVEISDVQSATMADEVARSVLKTVRDRVAPETLQVRPGSVRRRSVEARQRMRLQLARRAG